MVTIIEWIARIVLVVVVLATGIGVSAAVTLGIVHAIEKMV